MPGALKGFLKMMLKVIPQASKYFPMYLKCDVWGTDDNYLVY